MKRFSKKRRWLIVCSVLAAVILALSAWIYGWGVGAINVIIPEMR